MPEKSQPKALPIVFAGTLLCVIVGFCACIGLAIDESKRQSNNRFTNLDSHAAHIEDLLRDPKNWQKSFLQVHLASIRQLDYVKAVCFYRGGKLYLDIKGPGQTCSPEEQQTATSSPANTPAYRVPIATPDNAAAHMTVLLKSSAGYLVGLSLLLTVSLAAAITCGFLARSLKSTNQNPVNHYNKKAIKHLKSIAKDIDQTVDYKVRAEDHFQSDLQATIDIINKMLAQLQDNQNQIQDMAVSIQEKENELESQQKLFQDRNENLQKMFAGASHDLRQPLQAMVIFISALKESALPDQKPLVQKLEQVVDNLDHMFTDLLDLSKLESRMKRIPKQTVEIFPLLAKVYDEFEALAGEKKIELRLHNRDISVYSNPNMLERIIRNMISNAIRYTRTGGVLIGIRKRPTEIWIEVWDTGRGIPQEKMTEIFNEFVQIKEGDTEPNRGVGLGLFIVKRLAELLDHSIIVKSKIHEGTLFRVVVPSKKTIGTKSKLASFSSSTVDITHLLPNKSHFIVIVDDDATVRLSLKALLESWDMQVVDFDSIEALEHNINELSDSLDLMISDFQLGDQITGFDVIQTVHTNCSNAIPAIIVTGTNDQNILDDIKESRIPMLKKPVKPAKLRALINTLVSKQQQNQ